MDAVVGLGEIVELHPMNGLVSRAGQLAREIDHPVYDCLYLACAEATSSALVTADRKFAGKVSDNFPGIVLLHVGVSTFADDLEAMSGD